MRPLIALFALCSVMLLYPAATQAASAYDDVPRDNWAYAALDYLAITGVLEGYPDDFFDTASEHFSAGRKTLLTRYEFAQAIARLNDTISNDPAKYPAHVIAMANDLLSQFSDQLVENTCSGFSLDKSLVVADDRDIVVPQDDWAWQAKRELENKGLLKDYHFGSSIFSTDDLRSNFADMIRVATSRAYQLNDPAIDDLLDRLNFEFRDCLRLCAVAPAERSPAKLETVTP